jgi:hypothetical protein
VDDKTKFSIIKIIALTIIGVLFLTNTYALYGKADVVECQNFVCTFRTYNTPSNFCYEPSQEFRDKIDTFLYNIT